MTVLKAARTAQRVLSSTFEWNFDDTMLDTSGVSKNFGSSDLAMVADVINLPPGSQVVGGGLDILTAFDTAGYDVIIGDSGDTDRYMATADVKGLGHTDLLTPGYVNANGLNIRVTIASDDVCTTGKARLTVLYIIDGKADEVVPN
jgi:hypothetical protein